MKRFTQLFTTLALLAMLISCASSDATATKEALANTDTPPAPTIVPVNVKFTELQATTLTETIIISGSTLADTDTTYASETAGRIESLAIKLGHPVKKGQLLARIDYDMQRAQYDQANANHTLAKKTFDRIKELKSEDLISQQQIDEAESGYIQAEAQLRLAQANLNNSRVKAHTNGVVTQKFTEAGSFVGPGTPICRVVDYSTIIVSAQLAETQVKQVTPGTKANVRIDALNKEYNGIVDVILPAGANVSKTFELRINVANPDLEILVGMAATVKIVSKTHDNVIVVPQETIVEGEMFRSAYVIKDDVAEQRVVKLGATEKDKVIVTEGLNAGEKLVIVGQRALVDGQPVKIID